MRYNPVNRKINRPRVIKDENVFISKINKNKESIIHHKMINKTEQIDLDQCIVCNWTYPFGMVNEEKQCHLNYCLDGAGESHKNNYLTTLKVINLSLEEKNKDSDNPEGVVQIDRCPVCDKIFKIKSKRNKENHIIDCLREQDELMIYSNKKRRNLYN